MWSAIKSVFSKLGKSEGFKTTVAAIGTAAVGEIGARMYSTAYTRGYYPQQTAYGTGYGQVPVGAYGYTSQIPWGPILLVGGLVVAVMAFAGRGR